MKWLLALLLSVMSSAALAETTGAVNPGSVPAQPSVNDDVPPGGCMPIGMTTAGEIVFPIQCKEFIERHRGAAVEQKSAATQSESAAPEDRKPASKPVETLQKRVEHEPHQRAMRSDNCKSYRTYDSASGTYRGYDGRRRVCR